MMRDPQQAVYGDETSPDRSAAAARMVRPSGVEPPLLSEHGPEPCASANSATGARRFGEGGDKPRPAACQPAGPAFACGAAIAASSILAAKPPLPAVLLDPMVLPMPNTLWGSGHERSPGCGPGRRRFRRPL